MKTKPLQERLIMADSYLFMSQRDSRSASKAGSYSWSGKREGLAAAVLFMILWIWLK